MKRRDAGKLHWLYVGLVAGLLGACGTAESQEDAVAEAEAVMHDVDRGIDALSSESSACQALAQKIAAAHQEAAETPEWQALIASTEWQAYQQAGNELYACLAQGAETNACAPQQEALRTSWESVEGTEAFAVAVALPIARQMDEDYAAAALRGCWNAE